MAKELTFGDRYELCWVSAGLRSIGEVRNYTTDGRDRRSVPILLDDDQLERGHMRLIGSRLIENDLPEIIVSSEFMKLPSKLREAAVLHEIGHIHLEHLWSSEY